MLSREPEMRRLRVLEEALARSGLSIDSGVDDEASRSWTGITPRTEAMAPHGASQRWDQQRTPDIDEPDQRHVQARRRMPGMQK